jgi:hypothetical protein
VRFETKGQNEPIYRTSTAFFTPSKTAYPDRSIELQKVYEANTKTQTVNRYPADEKPQNAESAE